MNLWRKLFAEFIGTAGLLAVVVGSGIMGETLANGNVAIALLANSIATGAGLCFLILGFIQISGAHFNPVVTLISLFNKKLTLRESLGYLTAQFFGAIAGVGLANTMFELPVFFLSAKSRSGNALLLSEFVAAFGLIAVIKTSDKFHPKLIFFAVAAYITAAYWFTSSTSFANPAVTFARALSDTFAGINLLNVPLFILAQMLGAFASNFVFKWLLEENIVNDG